MSENNQAEGVCFPQGFLACGHKAGIKKTGAEDIAIVYSLEQATAAGIFTTNIVKAASIQISQKHLSDGKARAVVVSSGNANACNGEDGRRTAYQMCAAVATELNCSPQDVLIAQTGLIGIPIDHQLAVNGAKAAAAKVSQFGGMSAAKAMMTTDTVAKVSQRSFKINGVEVRVGGIAKGAAMISPSMATMLVVITTDARATEAVLKTALEFGAEESFHLISVDACRSTNDTVFLLANGKSGAENIDTTTSDSFALFAKAVKEVCRDLALMMIKDAEGASKFVRVEVVGARNTQEARLAAKAVTNSLLIKCSLAGEDPYWGRVLAECGNSGALFDPEKVSISYDGVEVCRNGIACDYDHDHVIRHMKSSEILITVDLKNGEAVGEAFGCDITYAYLDENIGTS